mmetsp:Transcript_2553/g.5884  ORF Transcript_2553/g.5884 Transcript_2553/m.5884 type:complete len:202 (+) Transcript_2553:1689-2294(+)
MRKCRPVLPTYPGSKILPLRHFSLPASLSLCMKRRTKRLPTRTNSRPVCRQFCLLFKPDFRVQSRLSRRHRQISSHYLIFPWPVLFLGLSYRFSLCIPAWNSLHSWDQTLNHSFPVCHYSFCAPAHFPVVWWSGYWAKESSPQVEEPFCFIHLRSPALSVSSAMPSHYSPSETPMEVVSHNLSSAGSGRESSVDCLSSFWC